MSVLDTVDIITPSIKEMNIETQTLDLSSIKGKDATVHFDAWDNIRVKQIAYVYLNKDKDDDGAIPITHVKVVASNNDTNEGVIPDATIPTYNGNVLNYIIGENTLHYKILTPDNSTHPNISTSEVLNFRVIRDEVSGSLKIDITEGAAAYTDNHKNLMPANIAIVRGVPSTIWKAHGDGNTRFQEAGGADSVVFQLDENGVCPINLIKIDHIDIGPRSDAASQPDNDGITLSRRDDKLSVLTSKVQFGDYIDVTGDAASQFKSYCINTKGIADGQTISIVSIIMQDAFSDQKIYVNMNDKLTLVKQTLRNGVKSGVTKDNSVEVKMNTAEFAITSNDVGEYEIEIYTTINNNKISFKVKTDFIELS